MRSLVTGRLVGLLVAVVVAACGSAPGAAFTTSITTANGDLPLPVSLHDQTGAVTAIGPAQVDWTQFRDAGILADAADPNAFVLTWLGGMCDSDVELALSSTASGHDLHIAIHEKLGLGCPAAGVLRAVRISTSQPLAIDTITISGSKSIQLIRDDDCGPLTEAATNDAKVACGVIITATAGEDPARFARVTVRPESGTCATIDCSTNAGIQAQPWRVDATDRAGGRWTWRCSYRPETATCEVVTQPSPS